MCVSVWLFTVEILTFPLKSSLEFLTFYKVENPNLLVCRLNSLPV